MFPGNQAIDRFPQQRTDQQQRNKRNRQGDGSRPILRLILVFENSKGAQHHPPRPLRHHPVPVRLPARQGRQQIGMQLGSTAGSDIVASILVRVPGMYRSLQSISESVERTAGLI